MFIPSLAEKKTQNLLKCKDLFPACSNFTYNILCVYILFQCKHKEFYLFSYKSELGQRSAHQPNPTSYQDTGSIRLQCHSSPYALEDSAMHYGNLS